jgi:hypothetical protein
MTQKRAPLAPFFAQIDSIVSSIVTQKFALRRTSSKIGIRACNSLRVTSRSGLCMCDWLARISYVLKNDLL